MCRLVPDPRDNIHVGCVRKEREEGEGFVWKTSSARMDRKLDHCVLLFPRKARRSGTSWPWVDVNAVHSPSLPPLADKLASLAGEESDIVDKGLDELWVFVGFVGHDASPLFDDGAGLELDLKLVFLALGGLKRINRVSYSAKSSTKRRQSHDGVWLRSGKKKGLKIK